MTEYTQQSTKAHARFEVKAAGWDDMPIIRGITELEKAWIFNQPWWNPPLDGPALDFGCGTGCLTMALRNGLGDNVMGVDTSRGMLEQFDQKTEGKGVTTVAVELTGPGQLGNGADESFALIYTSLTLHHIRDCERVMSTLAGYLRPGGRLVIFDLEATSHAHQFHPSDFEVGNELEHHGLREADVRAWCASTGLLEGVSVEHIPFKMEKGERGAFGVGMDFNLLAITCTRQAGGGSARNRFSFDGENCCLACKQREAEYECVPCSCRAFCKGCAMKVATGGRCKSCKNMFTDLKRLYY